MDLRYHVTMDHIARLSPLVIPPRASKWRLGADILMEDGPYGSRLYGRWDNQFGCWRSSPEGLVSVRPDVPFLGRHGRWLEPDGERDECWHASRAALAGYFSLIPTYVRRVAAPFGQRQWEMLEMIWRDPRYARELDRAATYDQFGHM